MKVTDEGVPVEALISVVKDSIKRAGISRTSRDRDLQVASVQLILDVGFVVSASSWLLVSVWGSRTRPPVLTCASMRLARTD